MGWQFRYVLAYVVMGMICSGAYSATLRDKACEDRPIGAAASFFLWPMVLPIVAFAGGVECLPEQP